MDENPEKHIRESAKELDLPGGSEIWMRTAERPDSLAGEGIRGVVLDEFTLMQENVWTEYIEATLLDYHGWALMIGVPKGQNWGARLWKNCATGPEGSENWRGKRKGWAAHHFTTLDNPMISSEDVEAIRQNTPHGLFEQEYLAKVVEHAGLVFKNLENCLGSERLAGPKKGHTYVFGLDWGKKNDFTVVQIMDVDERRLVEMVRFNDDDYTIQLGRVRDLYEIWQPRCMVVEENAVGIPLCDQLVADGLPINRFYTSNKSKREIIEALQVAFEQANIKIFDDPVLIEELESFECSVTTQGNIRYHAPEGESNHDDCVMSLALAWNEIRYDLGISL